MLDSVFVDGYWETNLGDDLFLYIIAKKYSRINFFITSTRDNYRVFNNIKNINLIEQKRTPIRRFLNSMSRGVKCPLVGSIYSKSIELSKRYPAYLELGGSLFILPKNGDLDVNYKKRTIISKHTDKYVIMGSNFGPYFSNKQLKAYRKLFTSVKGVSFRDKASYNLFSDIESVSYYPDVVFNLNVEESQIKSKNYTLFSVINTDKYGKDVDAKYTQFVIDQVKKEILSGNSVVLMSFCVSEGDTTKAKEILRKMSMWQDDITIMEHSDIEESLSVIKNAKKLFATRYHAMILGWLFNKPTFVVSYSSKTENVIKTYNPEQPYRKIREIKRNDEIEYYRIEKSRLILLREQAKKHFNVFDKVVLRK